MKKVSDAIHLEATVVGLEGPDYEGAGRVRIADSVFRHWTPSRWSRRMKMDQRMTLKDGRITIGSPGVYFIYAQVNKRGNEVMFNPNCILYRLTILMTTM